MISSKEESRPDRSDKFYHEPPSTTLPKALIKKINRFSWLIWLIPLGAAVGAAIYLGDYIAEHGPTVVLRFSEAEGIKAGHTPVQYRGVQIGRVSSVHLSTDKKSARVEVKLTRDQGAFARKGALYWIVRPEISPAGLSGFGTVLSGPYIEAIPGTGASTLEFFGLQESPFLEGEGLNLALHAKDLANLEIRSPVDYRGVQVGAVRSIELSPEGNQIDVRIVVWKRYKALVRAHTRFWIEGGFQAKGGLLSGFKIKFESIRSLISSSIAFATPNANDMGGAVSDDANFTLESAPKQDWLDWAPQIPISPKPIGL